MSKEYLLIKFLDDRKTLINAGKDNFQRVEFVCPADVYRVRQYVVRMIIGSEIVNLSKDLGACSRGEATSLYNYLLDELNKDSDVIDLRPVLQNILDRRKGMGGYGPSVCLD
nr:MAG TPA: hypothetical protein [Caudoviricetes sp.]